MNVRTAARAVFDAALAAADVQPLVLRALGHISPDRGRLIVVGAGKASGAMAAAVEEVWLERIGAGLVVVKDGHGAPTRRGRGLQGGAPASRRGGPTVGGARPCASPPTGPG